MSYHYLFCEFHSLSYMNCDWDCNSKTQMSWIVIVVVSLTTSSILLLVVSKQLLLVVSILLGDNVLISQAVIFFKAAARNSLSFSVVFLNTINHFLLLNMVEWNQLFSGSIVRQFRLFCHSQVSIEDDYKKRLVCWQIRMLNSADWIIDFSSNFGHVSCFFEL